MNKLFCFYTLFFRENADNNYYGAYKKEKTFPAHKNKMVASSEIKNKYLLFMYI